MLPNTETEAINELVKIYENTQRELNDNTLSVFTKCLLIATTLGSRPFNLQIRAKLAQVWLGYIELSCIHGRPAPVSPQAIEQTMRILTGPGVIEQVASNTNNHSLLAFVCLFSLCNEEEGHISSNSTSNVIGRWLNKHYKSTANNSEELAKLLYGTSVWDLYKPDYSRATDFAVGLYQMHIPLCKQLVRDSEPDVCNAITLPTEF